MKKLGLLVATMTVLALVLQLTPALAEESPETVYARYVKALTAGDINGALACMNNYQNGAWNSMNEDQRAQQLKQWKANCFAKYTVVKTVVKGKRAFLHTKARGKHQTTGRVHDMEGKISFFKENGEWKIYATSYR